jgi:hypothetical protein
MSKKAIIIKGLFSQFGRGWFDMPIKMLSSPPGDWGCRDVDNAHVKKIEDSICTLGTISSHGIGVIVSDDLYDTRDVTIAMIQDLKLPVRMVTGNHTRCAIDHLGQVYTKNPRFKVQSIRLLIFKNTPTHRFQLLKIGMSDNIRSGATKTSGWWDNIKAMHNQTMSYIRIHGDLPPQVLAGYRTEWQEGFNMAPGPLNAWYHVAKQTDELWDLIKMVCDGTVANPKLYRKPTSATIFNQMHTIPDDQLIRMLGDVVACAVPVNRFRHKCLMYKAKQRLLHEVLKQANLHFCQNSLPSYDSFDALSEVYPALGEQHFLDQWEGYMQRLPRRAKVSDSFCKVVETIVRAAKKKAEVITFFLFVL